MSTCNLPPWAHAAPSNKEQATSQLSATHCHLKKAEKCVDNYFFCWPLNHVQLIKIDLSVPSHLISRSNNVPISFSRGSERTKDFALLVKDHNHKGEARDLIKKIGDLESIYAVLKEDIVYYTETVNSLTVDKGNLERRVAKLERTMADMEAKYKKEIDGLKFAHQQELQALTTEIEGQKRAITGLEKELKQERVEHEKAVERKDVEIRNMQTLLNDQRERAKRQEIEFLKQMQSLEQSISQLKEKFFKEKKELQERYEDIIAKQKESYEIQIQKMKDDAEAMQRMLEEQIKQKSDYIALLEEDYKKLKESTDQQIKKLSLELDHAHATIHQLQDQISKLEQLIADLKKENGDLHAKVC